MGSGRGKKKGRFETSSDRPGGGGAGQKASKKELQRQKAAQGAAAIKALETPEELARRQQRAARFDSLLGNTNSVNSTNSNDSYSNSAGTHTGLPASFGKRLQPALPAQQGKKGKGGRKNKGGQGGGEEEEGGGWVMGHLRGLLSLGAGPCLGRPGRGPWL